MPMSLSKHYAEEWISLLETHMGAGQPLTSWSNFLWDMAPSILQLDIILAAFKSITCIAHWHRGGMQWHRLTVCGTSTEKCLRYISSRFIHTKWQERHPTLNRSSMREPPWWCIRQITQWTSSAQTTWVTSLNSFNTVCYVNKKYKRAL
jgi:hypothetical protein